MTIRHLRCAKSGASGKMARHLSRKQTSLRLTARWLLPPALALIIQSAVPSPSSAAKRETKYSISLGIEDLVSPGTRFKGDTLHLIPEVFDHGHTVTGGEIKVTSNDPLKKFICNIAVRQAYYYCNFSFPNTGDWTIFARYKSAASGPIHYLASTSINIEIFNRPPPGTVVT